MNIRRRIVVFIPDISVPIPASISTYIFILPLVLARLAEGAQQPVGDALSPDWRLRRAVAR